jgi:hypothetical protein
LARFLFVFLVLLSVFIAEVAGVLPLSAQNSTQASSFRPEVVVMVWSSAPDRARVALAYEKSVPRAEVLSALKRLQQCSGWEVASDLRIAEGKSLPNSKATTAAEMSLFHAPQWSGDEPAILPYLIALQNKSRIEVVFITGTPLMERAIDVAEDANYLVRRQVSATGMVRYEAEIRDHRTPLPPIRFGQRLERVAPRDASQKRVTELPATKRKTDRFSNIWLLMLAGGVLVGLGVWVYRMGNRSSTAV